MQEGLQKVVFKRGPRRWYAEGIKSGGVQEELQEVVCRRCARRWCAEEIGGGSVQGGGVQE